MEGVEHELNHDKIQNVKIAVKSCLHSFNDFAESLGAVLLNASGFLRNVQKLEELAVPEIVGDTKVTAKFDKKSIFGGYDLNLILALEELYKANSSLSDHMKANIGDNLDDFISQIVSPNNNQMHLAVEHNQIVVNELKNFMFSLYNHFLFGTSEMLENYLKNQQNRNPHSAAHSEYCVPRIQTNWKRLLKDKAITIRMNFRFEDIFDPDSNRWTSVASTYGPSSSRFLEKIIPFGTSVDKPKEEDEDSKEPSTNEI